MRSLDSIVALLDKYHQRATYGAVAGLSGGSPRSVMKGRKKDWLNSWVVNQETGMPTDYAAPMIHPKIEERPDILGSADDLQAWLGDPG